MYNNEVKIQDIPAEEIKKALLDCGLIDPIEQLITIGKNTHELISNLQPGMVLDLQLINSFEALKFHFDFYSKLIKR